MTAMPRKRVRQYRRMARTRRRLADDETRKALRLALKADYESGASIRQLATNHGLSYATVHTLLNEAGAVLRPRGGPNRTARHKRDEPPS